MESQQDPCEGGSCTKDTCSTTALKEGDAMTFHVCSVEINEPELVLEEEEKGSVPNITVEPATPLPDRKED